MKKLEINKSVRDLKDTQRDKATSVFWKLYAKRKGKYKDWNSLGAKTLGVSDKSDIRN